MLIREAYLSTYEVVDYSFPLQRHREPHCGLPALRFKGGTLFSTQVPAAPVVGRRLPSRKRGFPALLQFLWRAVAVVGFSPFQELFHHRPVEGQPLHLEVGFILTSLSGPFVPVKAQPTHGRENASHRFLAVAQLVGVLDAQDKGASMVASKEPVEECCSRASDVQISCRAGREPDTNRWLVVSHEIFPLLRRFPVSYSASEGRSECRTGS